MNRSIDVLFHSLRMAVDLIEPRFSGAILIGCLIIMPYGLEGTRRSSDITIQHARRDYQEWSREKELNDVLPNDFQMLRDSSYNSLLSFKAYIIEHVHMTVPAYKRYQFTQYLTDDGDLVSLQYLDWRKGMPVLTHRPLDVYADGRYTMFQLASDGAIELYTYDGRFYRDENGALRSRSNRRMILSVDDQPIYLNTHDPIIDDTGAIYENEKKVDTIKLVSFKDATGLWTFDGTVFYKREPNKVVLADPPSYRVIQGYHEAANKEPGKFKSTLIKYVPEANANTIKRLIESQETMFKAVYDDA